MIFFKTAISVSATVMLLATASFAQGEHPKPSIGEETTGMPTFLSHPEEKAQPAEINNSVGGSNAAEVLPASIGAPAYMVRTPWKPSRPTPPGLVC